MLKFKKIPYLNLDYVKGWFNFDFYYEKIYNHLPNNSKILEIGVFYGKSTCFMANLIKNNNKKVEFHCCDTFVVNNRAYVGIDNLKMHDNFKRKFENNLSYFNLSSCVIVHEGKSVDILSSFPNNYFDFIFVDGDHRYEAVKNDIYFGYQKIKSGGKLAGHDAHNNDIVRALEDLNMSFEFLGKWEENQNLNLLWEVCKK